MSGLAALAVREAAVASGLGTTFPPGIAPSAVEGFAVGTLLSGLCFLLVMASRRRAWWKWRAARGTERASVPQQAPADHDMSGHVPASSGRPAATEDSALAYVPAPGYAPDETYRPVPARARHQAYVPRQAYVPVPAYAAAGAISSPFADEDAEVLLSYPLPDVSIELPDGKNGDRTRRRLSAGQAERRPEVKRNAGRHAAPPAGVGGRLASRRASR